MHAVHKAVKMHPHFVFKGQALKKGIHEVSFSAANATVKINPLYRRCSRFTTK